MNVLSLFDGMSCGQIALNRLGIKYENYFASEIDKYAIQVAKANYPNTKHLGSVLDVDGYSLPQIDLLIGGSPCQSFSFAGKRKGMATKDEIEVLTLDHYLELKAQGYEFEGQSYLFWEYMRLLKETNPKYFLLENVVMGDKWERILSRAIGVNPVALNSSLFSAQNRPRLYWTNIGQEPQGLFGDLETTIKAPKDKGILLKDILEKEVADKYYLSDKMVNYLNTRAGNFNNGKINYKIETDKGSCINANSGHLDISDNIIVTDPVALKEVLSLEAKAIRKESNAKGKDYNPYRKKDIVERTDGKTGALLTSLTHDNTIKIDIYSVPITPEIHDCLTELQSERFDAINPDPSKASCLTTAIGRGGSSDEYIVMLKKNALLTSKIRKLTPVECERLQTVPDNYTRCVSDTQRYKVLGNGWTVDVIAYIFSFMPKFAE